jgi:hypothetical protein
VTKLLALLFALFVPETAAPFKGLAVRRGTHLHNDPKPFADLAAEAVFNGIRQLARRAALAVVDTFAAAQSWTAASIDPQCPSPRVAPEFAAAIGRSGLAPNGVAELSEALCESTRHLLNEVELRFSARFHEPMHARMAAGLFVSSLAMACAGIVGLVTIAAPAPVVHLKKIATAVNRVVVPAATAGTVQAAAETPKSAKNPETRAPVPAAPGDTTAASPMAAPLAPVPPASRGALPVGKGMWIWMEERAEGGDATAIVNRAVANGMTHVYVRTGTLKGGFIGGAFLERLLPVAHASGIRVYGWDFPYLDRPGDDVNRAVAAINYTTADGHRIDGFSADIESSHEGTNNSHEFVTAYVTWLRQNVGPDYPLIATVPNPTPAKVAAGYPYAAVVGPFDAIAPMVYWMNREPGADVANAIAYLSQFGKPILPIGQAYDGGPEGGPPGVPNRDSLIRFMQVADTSGAAGVSFWSWQHATQEAWDAVRDAAEFRLEVGGPNGGNLSPGMIRSYQTSLNMLGFPLVADGVWGPGTTEAVLNYQKAARLAPTGYIDEATRAFLLAPVLAPVRPD